MAQFSAAAELEITVPQSELRSARSQIERELGDIEVGVSGRSAAPSGGHAVGAGGSEPADIDLSRRQLGQQESLVGLAEERNEFLQQLTEGDVGGGGGGPGGLGTLLQVQGARSVLGGVGAGAAAGGGAAAGLGAVAGTSLLAGELTRILTGAEVTGGRSPATREVELTNIPDLSLQVPEGFPPELQIPELPQIDFSVPPQLAQLAQGLGIDINVNTQSNIQVSESLQRSERQRFEQAADRQQIESIARTEVERFEQRLRRQLEEGGGSL